MAKKTLTFDFSPDETKGFIGTLTVLKNRCGGDRKMFLTLVTTEALSDTGLLCYVIDQGTRAMWGRGVYAERRDIANDTPSHEIEARLLKSTCETISKSRQEAARSKQTKMRIVGMTNDLAHARMVARVSWYDYPTIDGILLGDATREHLEKWLHRMQADIGTRQSKAAWVGTMINNMKPGTVVRDNLTEEKIAKLAAANSVGREAA